MWQVYTWGCNDESSLGYSTDDGEVYEPRQVKALDDVNIVQVSAGDCHTCALAEDGRVYCWGVFRVGGVWSVSGRVLVTDM